MQWLAALCVRRPVFATVLILSFAVIGIYGYLQLGVDRMPKVDFPTIVVTTREPGAAPAQIETEVTDIIEEAVNTISGLDELRSTSAEGMSQVVVSFVLEKDTDTAAQEVRDRVNRVLPQLPRAILQPTVEKIDPDASPVLTVALFAPLALRDITEYADKVLRRQLETVDGVGQVQVLGGRGRQINVWLDADRLSAYNLTVTDVSRAVSAQNVELPGGRVEQGPVTLSLRTLGRLPTVAAFNDIVVRQRENHPIRLAEVARVEDGMAEPTSLSNVNGEPAVLLTVRRQSGTNTVEVVDAVKQRLADLAPLLPRGYALRIVRDSSQFIKASIRSVTEHLIVGSFLAALVVLVFLGNVRSTVIAAVAIPTSIVSTFGLIWYMDFTLNVMTMLALTLSVGIVIDDAIVVLENIYRFVEEKGRPPFGAAVEATREIGLAVMATTLSLEAIFVPVAFMGGIVGRFMKSFGLTMAFAIGMSLLVSFTLTPMMSARWIRARTNGGGNRAPRHTSRDSWLFRPLDRGYTRLLEFALAHRGLVVLASVLVLLSSVPLGIFVNKTFMPMDDQSEFEVSLRAPEGTSLESTQIIANRVATAVRQRFPEVTYTMVTVADDAARTPNSSLVYVRLTDIEQRARDQFAIMDEVRRQILPAFAADRLRATVRQAGGGMGGAAIQFVINGPDLARLNQYATAVANRAKDMRGVVDVDVTFNPGRPEVSVTLDRAKAADLGIQVAEAGEALRLLVGGDRVTTYAEGDEQYDVFLRAEAENRNDAGAIGRLTVPSARLGGVPLENIARFSRSEAPTDIARLQRERQVTVVANILPGASQTPAMTAMQEAAAELNMGPDYRTRFAGQSREMARAARNFVLAFLLSLAFMYMVLAAQFESWLHPVTILLALPLTLPFALIAIFLTGQSMNIMSALGLLVLFGVVKKNSILQIDHANQLLARGMALRQAVVQASRDRLRPILMTTLAFVAGMIPLVVSGGIGAGTNRAIGFVIIGGQSLVLVLTLVVTPVAYSLFDDASHLGLWARLRERAMRFRRRRATPAAPEADV